MEMTAYARRIVVLETMYLGISIGVLICCLQAWHGGYLDHMRLGLTAVILAFPEAMIGVLMGDGGKVFVFFCLMFITAFVYLVM